MIFLFILFISWLGLGLGLLILIILIALYDVFFQRTHTILHNYPVLGHLRYLIESIGPEIRQYLVANDREELPFNRSQRKWIYASSKKENNYQGFGSDKDVNAPNFIIIKPAMFPWTPPAAHPNKSDKSFLPSAKVIGSARENPYRPASVINVSAMSFGSLSSAAISALNKGSLKVGAYHNTGEGGLSPYHSFGADVCFHFGTGYFGVRSAEGGFSMEKMVQLIKDNPFIRMIEVKLSQGAKPGKGGVLPAKKITKEISEIRGVPMGEDVLSPSTHSAFSNIDELIDFVEAIAESTGLPVGIKSAVGRMGYWRELAEKMKKTGRGPDFITIDGGEGGTGAAPPAFADHVSMPFIYAFTKVYKTFQEAGISDKVVWIAAGKLGLPDRATMAFAMGADIINVAREAMMSIGCIQAQICHTNHCPTGIATQDKWKQRGLDVTLKSERYYNYVKTLRKELLEITYACGYEHPTQIQMEDVEVAMGDNNRTQTLSESYKYEKDDVPFTGMEELARCPYLGGNISSHHHAETLN